MREIGAARGETPAAAALPLGLDQPAHVARRAGAGGAVAARQVVGGAHFDEARGGPLELEASTPSLPKNSAPGSASAEAISLTR